MENALGGTTKIPEIALSIFTYTNLEAFKTGRLSRRVGRYPQVIVLQSEEYEVIIINMNEYQSTIYRNNSLYYFQSVNYIERIFNRYAIIVESGYLIDLLDNDRKKGPDFFNIKDIV